MLIRNVGKGNFSNTFSNGERLIRYLATEPIAPPAATASIFETVSIVWARLRRAIPSDIIITMAESIAFSQTHDRSIIYAELLPQIKALIAEEDDLIANLANIAAVLKEALGFFWVGFYLKKGDQLVLGPFQGPLACTRINFGEGVCGHAYSIRQTVVVPNVDEFPGHIACSSASKSEIVVPMLDQYGDAYGVLDVDSDRLDDFSEVDARGLNDIVSLLKSPSNDRPFT